MPRVTPPPIPPRTAQRTTAPRPPVLRPNVPRPPRGPRQISDRPSRWRLLLRRQRRLLRPACIGIAGFGVVVLGAMLVRAAAPGNSVVGWRERLGSMVPMRVSQVIVEGRANTPEPVLNSRIAITLGQPILSYSVAEARERIEGLRWVQHATVERRLPGTIVVSLQERRPYAIWQNQGHFVLIDRDGEVVADQDVAQFRDLPLVVGAGAPDHVAVLLDALSALPDLKGRVTAAVRVGERRWNLVLRNHITVLLPEGAVPAALARLMELQSQHALLDRPLQTVDLRLPDRLVVRVAPDASSAAPAGPGGPNPGLPVPAAAAPGPARRAT